MWQPAARATSVKIPATQLINAVQNLFDFETVLWSVWDTMFADYSFVFLFIASCCYIYMFVAVSVHNDIHEIEIRLKLPTVILVKLGQDEWWDDPSQVQNYLFSDLGKLKHLLSNWIAQISF